VGEAPFWGRFWELELLDESQKRLMEQVRDRIDTELSAYDRSSQRYGLIHADFVLENLMTENGKLRLIDFDDAGFGWHLFELATALYFIQEEPCYPVARQALIDGYRQARELSDEDLARMELFLAARGCTYLGWIRSRQETDTARELAPDLIRRACLQAERLLSAG
jgi:Ser/Thr protein kinase RdoA (MazF antagonist)